MSTSASTSTPDTHQRPDDPYNLTRFLAAQSHQQTYHRALSEIRSGRKRSHWMWFVFPQLAGLSESPSPVARRYAISGMSEAEAYLAHPVLGARLREIGAAVLENRGGGGGRRAGGVEELMGGSEVDVDKLRSCMTLFKRVVDGKGERVREEGDGVFEAVLERLFDGREDERTLERLGIGGGEDESGGREAQ